MKKKVSNITTDPLSGDTTSSVDNNSVHSSASYNPPKRKLDTLFDSNKGNECGSVSVSSRCSRNSLNSLLRCTRKSWKKNRKSESSTEEVLRRRSNSSLSTANTTSLRRSSSYRSTRNNKEQLLLLLSDSERSRKNIHPRTTYTMKLSSESEQRQNRLYVEDEDDEYSKGSGVCEKKRRRMSHRTFAVQLAMDTERKSISSISSSKRLDKKRKSFSKQLKKQPPPPPPLSFDDFMQKLVRSYQKDEAEAVAAATARRQRLLDSKLSFRAGPSESSSSSYSLSSCAAIVVSAIGHNAIILQKSIGMALQEYYQRCYFWLSPIALSIYMVVFISIVREDARILHGIWILLLSKMAWILMKWLPYWIKDDEVKRCIRFFETILRRLRKEEQKIYSGDTVRQLAVALGVNVTWTAGSHPWMYVLRHKMKIVNAHEIRNVNEQIKSHQKIMQGRRVEVDPLDEDSKN